MTPTAAEEARKQAVAAGLQDEELAATVEAAQLAAAIQAKDQGIRPMEYPSSPLAAEPQDLAAEIAFQRKGAAAFKASPIVRPSSPLQFAAARPRRSPPDDRPPGRTPT